MSKRGWLVICEKDYCDYIPCVEERIAQAAKVGAALPEQEAWLSELREQEGRFWSSESEWLATLDFQNARV